MGRRSEVRTGTAGGCLFNGCLTLCGLALVTFVGLWILLATQPGRDEDAARTDLRENVERHRGQLAAARADGAVTDAEIDRLFRPVMGVDGAVDVVRRGEAVTVVAQLQGLGPPRTFIFVNSVVVRGCRAFDVGPPSGGTPRVSVRELPDERCAAARARSRPSGTAR